MPQKPKRKYMVGVPVTDGHTSADSALAGTSAADGADLASLRGNLLALLPANEAKQLNQFLDRLAHKRGIKRDQMRRYRDRKKQS